MNIFKRENITLKNLSYEELRNLIRYFERNSSFTEYIYEVTAKRFSVFDSDLVFRITFPKSWISQLPMEKALQLVLGGEYEEVPE